MATLKFKNPKTNKWEVAGISGNPFYYNDDQSRTVENIEVVESTTPKARYAIFRTKDDTGQIHSYYVALQEGIPQLSPFG